MTFNTDVEFVRLFYLSEEVCTTAIQNLVQRTLLSGYNYDLIQYLNNEDIKHMFYHQLERKIRCCVCPPEGCRSFSKLHYRCFFLTLYVFKNDHLFKCHHNTNGKFRTQFCVHSFSAKQSIALNGLDRSTLICLLEPCMASLLQNERNSLTVVREIRNEICHTKPTDWIAHDISSKWSELETAILCLDDSNNTKVLIQKLKENIITFTESEFDDKMMQIENYRKRDGADNESYEYVEKDIVSGNQYMHKQRESEQDDGYKVKEEHSSLASAPDDDNIEQDANQTYKTEYHLHDETANRTTSNKKQTSHRTSTDHIVEKDNSSYQLSSGQLTSGENVELKDSNYANLTNHNNSKQSVNITEKVMAILSSSLNAETVNEIIAVNTNTIHIDHAENVSIHNTTHVQFTHIKHEKQKLDSDQKSNTW